MDVIFGHTYIRQANLPSAAHAREGGVGISGNSMKEVGGAELWSTQSMYASTTIVVSKKDEARNYTDFR